MNKQKQILNKWIFEQDNYYSVRAYFENEFPIESGQLFPSNQKVFNTKKETISVAKCVELIQKVEAHFQNQITKIVITMNEYDYKSITEDDVDYIMCGDMDVKRTKHKSAEYFKKENRLIIYENGYPIYENDNGTITRDSVALCDTYC